MRLPFRVILTAVLGLFLASSLTAQRSGKPGKSPGFALFAAYGAIIAVNRAAARAAPPTS